MSKSLARAVLIGGTGFIGKAINHELSRIQVPVLSIASNFINLLEPMAEYQLRKVIKKTDSIVMLSALTPKWGKGPDIFTKNIHMLDVVLKVASDINVRHFIYFSSDAVYGIKEGLISESSSLNPVDLYGAMHLSRELMLAKISHIPTMILRPTMVYGFGDTHNAYGPNRFLNTSKIENEIALFGEGEELRDYIAVEDVAKITSLILQKKYNGILNLATGNSMTFKKIAEFIKANRNHPTLIKRMQRLNNIFHRQFDTTNLIKMFPSYQYKKLEDYLQSS